MTTLFLLISLLASDCRVHRVTPEQARWCNFECNESGCGPCLQQSHWLPCTVVEKCDTVRMEDTTFIPGVDMLIYKYEVRCHPETTLVDSGKHVTTMSMSWKPVNGGMYPAPIDEDTLWILGTPFLRSEMPDLKEMLREWRVEKCFDSAYNVDMRAGRWPYYKAIRDSCECVYGGGK